MPTRREVWLRNLGEFACYELFKLSGRVDHRAIKRRCASMAGFKSFTNAAIAISGIELAHRIRKRQFSFGRGRHGPSVSLKQLWDRALA